MCIYCLLNYNEPCNAKNIKHKNQSALLITKRIRTNTFYIKMKEILRQEVILKI